MNAVGTFYQYFSSWNFILIYMTDKFVNIQERNEIVIDFAEFSANENYVAESKTIDKIYDFLMLVQGFISEFFHVT